MLTNIRVLIDQLYNLFSLINHKGLYCIFVQNCHYMFFVTNYNSEEIKTPIIA